MQANLPLKWLIAFDAFGPSRSFPAAYALFIAIPFLAFIEAVALNWLTLRVAPLFPTLALVSSLIQAVLGQVLMLLGASLPAWLWFRHLRRSPRNWSGITIGVIALAHFLMMQWWCFLGYDSLREYAQKAT